MIATHRTAVDIDSNWKAVATLDCRRELAGDAEQKDLQLEFIGKMRAQLEKLENYACSGSVTVKCRFGCFEVAGELIVHAEQTEWKARMFLGLVSSYALLFAQTFPLASVEISFSQVLTVASLPVAH